mgnify:CR=1 FL=1
MISNLNNVSVKPYVKQENKFSTIDEPNDYPANCIQTIVSIHKRIQAHNKLRQVSGEIDD